LDILPQKNGYVNTILKNLMIKISLPWAMHHSEKTVLRKNSCFKAIYHYGASPLTPHFVYYIIFSEYYSVL